MTYDVFCDRKAYVSACDSKIRVTRSLMHDFSHVLYIVMGRRKQLRPHRSVGIVGSRGNVEGESKEPNAAENAPGDGSVNVETPFFVEVDKSSWELNEHFDISEVLLTNLNLSIKFKGYELSQNFYQGSDYSLRFRLCNVIEHVGRMKLGHWPVIPASDIYLEVTQKCMLDGIFMDVMIVSGRFDGPDEGVTGLVHLASLKFLTLRPLLGLVPSEEMSSLRLRVEILKSAFDACESILDNTRQLWKRSMMSAMSWLRPEVMTSEARYGYSESVGIGVSSHSEINLDSLTLSKRARFDAAGFYEAIKPSK